MIVMDGPCPVEPSIHTNKSQPRHFEARGPFHPLFSSSRYLSYNHSSSSFSFPTVRNLVSSLPYPSRRSVYPLACAASSNHPILTPNHSNASHGALSENRYACAPPPSNGRLDSRLINIIVQCSPLCYGAPGLAPVPTTVVVNRLFRLPLGLHEDLILSNDMLRPTLLKLTMMTMSKSRMTRV